MNLSLSQRQQDILMSEYFTFKQMFVFCLYISTIFLSCNRIIQSECFTGTKLQIIVLTVKTMINGLVTWIKCKWWRSVLKWKYSEKEFLSPQCESNTWPSRYQLHALTTELWETHCEQGYILGSHMCDMCPAIVQGSTCRNDKCE